MADKFNSKDMEVRELAQHLKKPTGDKGIEVALEMNKGNKHICLNSYKVLNPKNEDSILEIGMGNGFFVKDLLLMAENMKYVGLDFSKTMVEESKKNNEGRKNVSFYEASVEKLPFENDTFDLITTTNTIYFWPNLVENLKEISRILKPNGKLLIAYRSKTFMDKIELSNYGFNKFNSVDVEKLLSENNFNNIETIKITEPELKFDNKAFSMEGVYTCGLKK